MSAIVFGSPEAKEILAKDKELQRQLDGIEEDSANIEALEARKAEIEDELSMLEDELFGLEGRIENARRNRRTS